MLQVDKSHSYSVLDLVKFYKEKQHILIITESNVHF